MKQAFIGLSSVFLALTVTGCGSSKDTDSTEVVTDSNITITGMDGYYQNAVVFDDVNSDGVLDTSDTLYGLTDSNGQLTLDSAITLAGRLSLQVVAPGGTAQSTLITMDAATYAGVYTIDTDYPGTTLEEMVLATTAKGEASTVISPLTDLVAVEVATDATEDDIAAAEANVASWLDIDVSDIYSDYSDNGATHKKAQVVAASKLYNGDDYEQAVESVATYAATTVASMSEEELDSVSYVPVISVTSDESGSVTAITVANNKATVDSSVEASIQAQLTELAANHGGVIPASYIDVAELFSDADVDVPVVSLTYSAGDSGIAMSLTDNELVVSADVVKASEDKTFTLTINDVSTNGDTAVGDVAVTFTIPVTTDNNAPTYDSNVLAQLQTTVNEWLLTEGEDFDNSFTIDGLFADADGDSLVYSATTTASGLNIEVSDTMIVVSGTPTVSGEDYSLTLTASDNEQTVSASLSLPEIEEGTDSSDSSDTEHSGIYKLLDNTWYVLDHGSTSYTSTSRVFCNTWRFVDGMVLSRERSATNMTSCEADTGFVQQEEATYAFVGNTMVVSFTENDETSNLVLSLLEDDTPGDAISTGALTVLAEEDDEEPARWTFFANAPAAEERIALASDAGAESRSFNIWFPSTLDENEFQVATLALSMSEGDGSDGETVGADADLTFDPAEGDAISCEAIEDFYEGFSFTNTDEVGEIYSEYTCYDNGDHATLDFDFYDPTIYKYVYNSTSGEGSFVEVDSMEDPDAEYNVEYMANPYYWQSDIYTIIGTVAADKWKYVGPINLNMTWTGTGNTE